MAHFPRSSSIMQVTYSTLFVSLEEEHPDTARMVMSLIPVILASFSLAFAIIGHSPFYFTGAVIRGQSLKFPTLFDLSSTSLVLSQRNARICREGWWGESLNRKDHNSIIPVMSRDDEDTGFPVGHYENWDQTLSVCHSIHPSILLRPSSKSCLKIQNTYR